MSTGVGAAVEAPDTASGIGQFFAAVMDTEFYDLMPTPVVWQRYNGEDGFGNNVFVTGGTLRVRLEPVVVSMNVSTQQGGSMLAAFARQTNVIADITTPLIAAGDRITLETGVVLRVVDATVHYDENGPYYQDLQCQNNQEN